MQRRHHYEQALEHYLRTNRVPYVAVDEARKALVPEAAGAINDHGLPALKSFDLVIYGDGENLLAEVKGRRVSLTGRSGRRLENWATQDDVASLRQWQGLFGEGFTAAFLFVYWCEEQPPAPLFEEIFGYRDRWYAIRTIAVDDYARVMRVRSPRWRTVHLPAAEFDRLSRPFHAGGAGRPAADSRPAHIPLHAPAVEVASPAHAGVCP